MVVHAGDRHAAGADRLAQHAEPAEVGDVEHHDGVGPPELAHGLAGAVDAGQVLEQERRTAAGSGWDW